MKKTLAETKGVSHDMDEKSRQRHYHLKSTLTEQLQALTKLDSDILDLLNEDETIEDEAVLANEIEEAGNLRADIKTAIRIIDEALDTRTKPPEENSSTGSVTETISPTESQSQNHERNDDGEASGSVTSASGKSVRVRLPKITIRNFDGKIEQWQEFWDCFTSAVDKNDGLSDIDKFSYLRGYLRDQARAAISGFALTSANYKSAKELLKQRYGRNNVIQKTHIKELLRITPVFSDRDPTKLRALYDAVETRHRGLQAIGVPQESYSSIVVPAIIDKIPDSVRLSITRGKRYDEWKMDEMLKELLSELELREEHWVPREKPPRDNHKGGIGKGEFGTTSAFMTKGKTEEEAKCAYCLGKHKHEECETISMISDRKSIVRKYGRCYVCLSKGHLAKNCSSKLNCKLCGKRHHISLCGAREPEVQEDQVPSSHASPNMHVSTVSRVALQTAQGYVKGNAKDVRIRVMFDTGSHKSFVTSSVAHAAGLSVKRKEWIEITTFGQVMTDRRLREVFELQIRPVEGGDSISIEAYGVSSIAQVRNEHIETRRRDYPHLQKVWFSDVCKHSEVLEIDVLIGSDSLWRFQGGETLRGKPDEPVAVATRLGWVLSGPIKGSRCENEVVNVKFVKSEGVSPSDVLHGEVQRLWDLDTLGIREECEVHESLKEAISFNGRRYQVRLPWKEGHAPLPSNYRNSLKRMKSQLNRLRREPEVLKEYDRVIKEQLEKGIIEPVVEMEGTEKIHYLPHHAVVRREAKTTKVRVVYDASSKEEKGGVSLNDCLHVGPPLTPLLFNILLRFREKRIALVADIEKAFLNVEIEGKERNCLRFLWVEDVDCETIKPVEYRFCRVVFGVNCSPFLLNATLQYHLDSYVHEDPEFVRKLKDGFYVDDLVSGEQTEDRAERLYCIANERLLAGGFRLRKWLSNSPKLKEVICQSDCPDDKVSDDVDGKSFDNQTYAKATLGTTGERGEAPVDKVLGIQWNSETDTFHFDLNQVAEKANDLVPTKRNILSVLAGLYDPLGLISPLAVSIKVLFQELCVEKLGWDDELSDSQKERWKNWVRDLEIVREIVINRCLYRTIETKLSCSLHGFADASVKAYSAVIYFVCEVNGSFQIELLTSKTRVAPLKTQTIPRLELMSGRILASLMSSVRTALEQEVEIVRTRYWLDSKTALCWIDNKGEWKQFVRHRVNEILRLTKREEWGHCPGEENPADVGSRGSNASTLRDNHLWWKGPKWLSGPEEMWPAPCEVLETPETSDETKKSLAMAARVEEVLSLENVVDIGRFGRLSRLIRVTAWVIRFTKNARAGRRENVKETGKLKPDELCEAETVWVKTAQEVLKAQENYRQLVNRLQIVEEDGVLRCKGRLKNSDLEIEGRKPKILPKDHPLTALIIKSCHEQVHHLGLRATLAQVRSQFWIPRGRQTVKNALKGCPVCKRHQGKPFSAPIPADLPDFRVKQAPPFSKVGVDFAGPLYVKEVKGMAKVYVALWSCCVTRAVHLDLVRSLTTGTFLNCLRRFASRRGRPSLIISDNAKTFKAASKVLKGFGEDVELNAYLENNHIDWKFNLEKTPWWGGFFERMVGTVKRCLRKVLGNAKLTYDELLTTLIEVEGTINSRPLTYEYDEVGVEVLTPSHLIFGRRLQSIPDGKLKIDDDDDNDAQHYLSRHRFLARTRTHFWNRWKREYLADLREYHKGNENRKGSEVKLSDVVLVYDENLKRSCWKLAVVERLIVGKDNVVRGALVRLIVKGKPRYLSRPVQRLYPLEVKSKSGNEEADEARDEGTARVQEESCDSDKPRRSRRAAALDSERRTKAMLEP